jgi:glycosyltransferase involved in cell wall biosynthesis
MEWISKSNVKTKIKMKRVQKVICNSLYTKGYIDKKFGINSEVIYPPVFIPAAEAIKKENVILNVGRYGIQQAGSSYKKQEILIDAFKELLMQEKMNWRLVLVISILERDMDRLNDLKKSIQGYPIELIINPQSTVLWEVYRKAKIYWHAAGYAEDLDKHPDRAEHFGISTVEAMGVGAVPIVINAGGQKEIIKNEENGFVWNTKDQLIQQTKKVMENAELLNELSKKSEQRARDFSQKVFCDKIATAIR